MKFSSKVEKSGLSPMRKFHPYAVAAEARARKSIILTSVSPISRHRSSFSMLSSILSSPFWPMLRLPVCLS